MYPFSPVFTPATSRSRLLVSGARPIAHKSSFTTSSSLPGSVSFSTLSSPFPSLIFSTSAYCQRISAWLAFGLVLTLKALISPMNLHTHSFIPIPNHQSQSPNLLPKPNSTHLAVIVSCTIGSKLLKNVSPLINKCTSTPTAFNMPAISTAIYPAPTTAILLGSTSISKNPSFVIPNSAPGISVGMRGYPPLAIQMCFAEKRASPLSITQSVSEFSHVSFSSPSKKF